MPLTQRTLGLLLVAFALGPAAMAQPAFDPDAPRPTPPTAQTAQTAPPPIKEIAPGVFELGAARLDKNNRTVTFPAVLNLADATPVEYLLVTENGKTHESVLRTTAEPFHLQLALLLLGGKGAGTNEFPLTNAPTIPGDKINVEISWLTNGQPRKFPAEDLVWNRRDQKPMKRGPWVYNGSLVIEGQFMAQQEGSIISLMIDPAALINNPRPGAEDDERWLVNTNNVPPLDWPVEVTIKLPPEKKTLTP